MASLTLRLEDQVLKEYAIGSTVTIGRSGDNTVVIDNAAVSSHHACVLRDGDDFVMEDLQSTNGTFVNGTRVGRRTLQHGDVVLIGKHQLVFDQHAARDLTVPEGEPAIPIHGETVFLDKQQHQRLLAIVMNAEDRARAPQDTTDCPAALGALRVLAGRADRSEYLLEGHTSLIGRASWTLVRLKGWFKPGVAVAITRHQQGYVATLLRGKMLINSHQMNGRHDLKEGDIIEVGGLTLAFTFKESSSRPARDNSQVAKIESETSAI